MANIDEVSSKLIQMAADQFKKSATDLSPDDDFFDALGIHSVDALALLTRIENTFKIEVADFEVQDVRTFRGLAEVVVRRL